MGGSGMGVLISVKDFEFRLCYVTPSKFFLLSKASEVHLVVGLLKQNFPSIVHTLTNISFFISINVFLSLSIFLYFSISLFSLSLYLLLFLSVFFFLFFYLSPINVFLSLSFYFSTSHCSFFTPICVFLSFIFFLSLALPLLNAKISDSTWRESFNYVNLWGKVF